MSQAQTSYSIVERSVSGRLCPLHLVAEIFGEGRGSASQADLAAEDLANQHAA